MYFHRVQPKKCEKIQIKRLCIGLTFATEKKLKKSAYIIENLLNHKSLERKNNFISSDIHVRTVNK